MFIDPRVVRTVAQEIAEAADGAMDSYRSGEVTEEPHVTDRMLGAIAERLRSKTIGGLVWNAKTLRAGRGIAGEEKRHGADFMGVLSVNIKDFSVKKGFLVQAKRAEPGVPFSQSDWKRMVGQCEAMLERTPDSFVAVYSKKKGIRFIPAIEVVASANIDLFAHYSRGITSFFELFLVCFIGDRRLHSADIKVLDALTDYPVRDVIELIATEIPHR